jgi:hypothetical protein
MEIDRNAPATKGDVEDFKVEVNTRFREFEERMEQSRHEMEGRIITTMYRLMEAVQQRQTQSDVNLQAFNLRMSTMERRMLEVEKRLDIPPAANN